MKNKVKVIAGILLISACFAGCSADKGAENNTANVASETKVDSPAKTYEESPIFSIEEFQKNIENYVTISNYELSDSVEGKHCYYNLKKDLQKDYELDYTISLDGGANITMPMAFEDLVSQGWELTNEDDADVELKAGYSTSGLCTYNGKKITVYTANLTDSTSTYGKGTIHRVLFNLSSSNDNYTTELASAPEFTVCKNIDNNSSIEDIIATLGEPTYIRYSIISDAYSHIELSYQNKEAYNSLDFNLTSDGSRIVNIDYNVDPTI